MKHHVLWAYVFGWFGFVIGLIALLLVLYWDDRSHRKPKVVIPESSNMAPIQMLVNISANAVSSGAITLIGTTSEAVIDTNQAFQPGNPSAGLAATYIIPLDGIYAVDAWFPTNNFGAGSAMGIQIFASVGTTTMTMGKGLVVSVTGTSTPNLKFDQQIAFKRGQVVTVGVSSSGGGGGISANGSWSMTWIASSSTESLLQANVQEKQYCVSRVVKTTSGLERTQLKTMM